MKNRYLLGLSGIGVFALAGCGKTTNPSTSNATTTVVEDETTTVDETTTKNENTLPRETFLNKLDEMATANADARAALTSITVMVGDTQVNGDKLPIDSTGIFELADGKVTILEKEFTILVTKANFEADYLDGVTEYESESYTVAEDGMIVFNFTVVKNDGVKYQYAGKIKAEGTLYACRCFSVTDSGRTTLWWLSPAA